MFRLLCWIYCASAYVIICFSEIAERDKSRPYAVPANDGRLARLGQTSLHNDTASNDSTVSICQAKDVYTSLRGVQTYAVDSEILGFDATVYCLV